MSWKSDIGEKKIQTPEHGHAGEEHEQLREEAVTSGDKFYTTSDRPYEEFLTNSRDQQK